MAIPSGTEAVRAFIPAMDFNSSKAFYEALGFKILLDGDVTIFGVGDSAFILQRYYKKEWAENCMMQMMVDDLDVVSIAVAPTKARAPSCRRARARLAGSQPAAVKGPITMVA